MITAKVVCNPLKEGYKTVFEEDFSCWQGIYVTLVLHLQDTGVLFVQHKCSTNEMQVACKWRTETLFQQVVDCIHRVDVACCQIYYILILAPKKRIVLPVLGEVRFQYPDARHHTSGMKLKSARLLP